MRGRRGGSRRNSPDLREVVLSSVVKDTIEATRVKASLASKSDPFLLEIYLELAVWEAAQSQFVRHAPLDDRILLSRFFDQVRRLARLLDFYREIRAEIGHEQNEAALRTCENIAMHWPRSPRTSGSTGSSSSPTTAMRPRSVSSAYDRGQNSPHHPAASIQPEQACRNF